MAKGEELVKFITQRVVTYLDTPKEVRRQHRVKVKISREPWGTRWFGVVPMGLQMWWEDQSRKYPWLRGKKTEEENAGSREERL